MIDKNIVRFGVSIDEKLLNKFDSHISEKVMLTGRKQ
jgi:metal-responsive CopG/Arc/MetJ family transcriptional regulator